MRALYLNNTYLIVNFPFSCYRDHSIQEARCIPIRHLSMCICKSLCKPPPPPLLLSCFFSLFLHSLFHTHTAILSYFLSFVFSSAKIRLVICLKSASSFLASFSLRPMLCFAGNHRINSWNVSHNRNVEISNINFGSKIYIYIFFSIDKFIYNSGPEFP